MPPLTAPMLARAPPHLMPQPPPVQPTHARPVTSSWPPPPSVNAVAVPRPEPPQGPTVQQLNWALQLAIGARLVPGSAPSSLPLVITALDPARRHFVARMQVGPAHLTAHGTLHPAAVAAAIDVVAAVLPLLAPAPPPSSSSSTPSAPPVRSILWPSARANASPLPFAAVPVVPHLTVLEAHAILMAPTLGTAMASIDVMVIPPTSPGAPATAWPVLVASSRLPGAALPPPPVVPASVAALGAGLAPHHRPKI
ncbi:hypothetical protein AMAG_08597 [Allomyces macrogynus ATCC 38327]|uniref:Uncharacterized protein n=1 Tax=Allomyces macrogynus (strain ATCC 38327) TaxID=578462 RepID=A0A0L0SLU7_ALLM3|nr:hypothetical protein AMAG_08597 [Allomyces macrogynus ATCC 38327]|eukprot:KNE63472.1 hypothetical protein AMAG_08597 [Allomyces macrogynus ATCC 38327]